MKSVCFFLSCFLLFATSCQNENKPKEAVVNPFAIDFPEKENLTAEDYEQIQEKLHKIDIHPMLQTLYAEGKDLSVFGDFHNRCVRGIRQVLIDREKGYIPQQHLEKIGEGGDNCIICCFSFNRPEVYPVLMKEMKESLEKTGFNGYLFYQLGGFPIPTGKETKWIGVPYSFKVFMMLEAQKRGFNKVLWLDVAAIPLRDPTPLFTWMEESGGFLNLVNVGKGIEPFILPATRKVLKETTGTDVFKTKYLSTIIFGLDLRHPKAQKLVKKYYELVELGTPFLSCFPEEFVLTAIVGQKELSPWKKQPFERKLLYATRNEQDSEKEIDKAKRHKFFFYHRKH